VALASSGDVHIPPQLHAQACTSLANMQQDCLRRLHIIKPHSSMHLLAALLSLPRLLAHCQVRDKFFTWK